MKPFGFPKSLHIRRSEDFQRLYKQGQRAGDNHLLIFALPNDLNFTRIGLSVSRKHGSAVHRVRIKRLLREAFRLSRPELPAGLDLVLVPRVSSEAELADYRRSLLRLTRKLARRLGEGQT